MTVRTPVYLDHHATTPLDSRVLEAMMPVLRERFGNPASVSHAFGWTAAKLVEEARAHVAALLGCRPDEIVFTSGATESCNLALRGVADLYERPRHMVTSVLEHEAVDRPLADLERRGWRVTRVPCRADGIIDPVDIAAALCDDTVLVSLIAAQNEIGTIQSWGEVASSCSGRGVLFHTDAAQAVGRIPLDVTADGIDLLGFSAHKLYGPKGVGALFVRRGRSGVRLVAQMTGGGQERGLRSGTLNVPGIVGMGEACRLALLEREERAEHLRRLAGELYAAIADGVPDVRLNGAAQPRLPGSLNLSFPGLEAAGLIRELSVLALSTGSACGSGRPGPSPALLALGLDEREAGAGLRIGLGKDTTDEEASFAAARIVAAVCKLRSERLG